MAMVAPHRMGHVGYLLQGEWKDEWYDTSQSGGRFLRSSSQFRHWVTADGSAGPTGCGGFKAEAGRYHLYVSLACPWAHRTLIFRVLKGLQQFITVSVVHWFMGEQGWSFHAAEGVTGDPNLQAEYLHQIYSHADAHYTGRVTVPVLWDKETRTIVSNESAEIIRMFNSAFDGIGAAPADYYPKPLRSEIDRVNEWIYDAVNNGVYRCGFATSQLAYEEAITPLFEALDNLEERLGSRRYLMGDTLTEADWRLFTTLLRFDPVYVGHFKCNLRRLADYPNLSEYVRELYQMNGIAATVDLNHIKKHYYQSHTMINPTGIVPAGPLVDFTVPHQRAALLTRPSIHA